MYTTHMTGTHMQQNLSSSGAHSHTCIRGVPHTGHGIPFSPSLFKLLPPPLLLNSDHQIHKSTKVRTPRCSLCSAPHSRHHQHVNPSLSVLQLLLGGCGHTGTEARRPAPPPSLGERRTHTRRDSQTPEPELATPLSVL
jgi:hypothetical protein